MSLYSQFGASRRPPLLMTMSISRFLSAVNGSPLSPWSGIPSRSCERSRGEVVGVFSPAPRLWDRCVVAGRPRPPHRSRGTSLPRAPRSYEAPCHAHDICCKYDTERDCWPCPKERSGSCPSITGPFRRPWSHSLLPGRSVPAGVPSPAAVPARLCGQHAFPG